MDHKVSKNWTGAVFGMIFVLSGLAAAYGISGKLAVGYVASSSWVEVPATIHDIKLVSSRGDSTTYSVESNYTYVVNGVRYDSDRVSLSTRSDNLGAYWQDLERTLRRNQRNNEAFAIVNPNDPTQSLLDRTFRWKTVIIGSIFLVLFGGIGGFITWWSLRGTKKRKERLQDEKHGGISSDQKNGSLLLAGFGGVFLVVGVGMSLLVLPDAISKGQYGALAVLLFAVVGAGIVLHAFKLHRAFKRFGPTPLFLDPVSPGVGGQLGGRFSINVVGIGQQINPALPPQARLTCTRRSKSGKSTSYSVKWQEEAPVYLKETAHGVEASFLFEIPDSCISTKEWSRGSAIEWNVTIEGEFSDAGLGKFERNWEVVVEESGAQASSVLSIPQSFMEKEEQKSESRVKASALVQVPVIEDSQYITVHSKAMRDVGGKMIMILFGAVFTGAGVFTIMQSWWPGYIFLVIGSLIVSLSVFFLGKSIEVVIDKDSHMLYTQESWFGLKYARRQGEVHDGHQFKIKKTSSSSTHNKLVEYYAVYFEASDAKFRIADGIEGKKEALALIESIVDRCFDEEQQAAAA